MLIKRTISYLPAQLLSPLAQLSSILLWTFYGGSTTIGIITLVTTQQELIRTICLSWWSHFAMRYMNEKCIGEKIKQSNTGIVVVSILLQAIVTYLTFIYFFNDLNRFYYLYVIILFVALRSINQHNITLAATNNNALLYNVLSLCGPLLGLLVGLILVSIYGDDALFPLLGYVIGEFIGIAYLGLKSQRYVPRFTIDVSILYAALRYGIPILISGIFAWLALNTSRYMIEDQLGLEAVGAYAIGFGLGHRAASMIGTLFTPALLPLVVSTMQEQGEMRAMQQLSANFLLLSSVLFPALLSMFMVDDLIVKLFVAPEYWAVTLDILPWSIVSGGLFTIIYNYLNHYFIVMGETKYLILIDGGIAFLVFVFSYLLIGQLGLKGGVIAMCVAAFLVMIMLLFYLLTNTHFIFPYCRFLMIILAVAIMCSAMLLVSASFDSLVVQFLTSLFTGWAVYLSLISFLHQQQTIKVLNHSFRCIKG